MGRGRRIAAVAGSLAIVGMLTACNPQQPWRSELVSVTPAGDSGNGSSGSPVFSADGTKVAFMSNASNLGPPDRNAAADVYVRDVADGTTTLASVRDDGTDGGNGDSTYLDISADGTKVVFMSRASDLGPRDTNGLHDVYVRDLTSGTTTLVSVNAAGTDSGGSPGNLFFSGWLPTISRDGSKVAFFSWASDLVPNDHNGVSDLYVRDLETGTTSLVSVNAAGTNGGNRLTGFIVRPVFSPDGTKIAFMSDASDLVAGDRAYTQDLFVRDLVHGTTTRMTAKATSATSGTSGIASFSADGTQIAFDSGAPDLVPDDTNGVSDVFVRDLVTGTTTLVSTNTGGSGASNGRSEYPVLSADGTRLAFVSDASDLGPTDTNGTGDVYVRDLAAGATTLVSANADGTDAGNAGAAVPVGLQLSADGSRVAFASDASNLGPRDTNTRTDLYVRDLATGTTTLVSANADGTDSGNDQSPVSTPNLTPMDGFSFHPSGTMLAFATPADNLGPRDTNAGHPPFPGPYADVYVATLHGADLSAQLDATPEPVATGGELTYELTVTNAGPDGAEAATAALLLPEEATVVATASDDADCAEPPEDDPGLITCEIGDLGADATATVTVTATIAAPPDTSVTAIALVGSDALDPAGSNDSATVESTVSAGP